MEYMLEKKRIDWVDIAKGIGIIIVVLDHAYMIFNKFDLLKYYIISFHMPLFFALSGMFAKRGSIVQLVKKRFFQILIPYLLWYFLLSPVSLNWTTLKNLLVSNHPHLGAMSLLWFMPCVFFNNILMRCIMNVSTAICKKSKARYFLVIIIASIFFVFGYVYSIFHNVPAPWQLDVAYVSLIFSAFLNILYDVGFFSWLINQRVIVLSIISVILLVLGYLCLRKDFAVIMALHIYGNPIRFVTSAFLGIFFIIIISMLVSKIRIAKWFVWLGKNTLIVFALHLTVLRSLQFVYGKVQEKTAISYNGGGYLAIYVTAAIALLLCSIAILFLEKYLNPLYVLLSGKFVYENKTEEKVGVL